jgi:hypothetical protein
MVKKKDKYENKVTAKSFTQIEVEKIIKLCCYEILRVASFENSKFEKETEIEFEKTINLLQKFSNLSLTDSLSQYQFNRDKHVQKRMNKYIPVMKFDNGDEKLCWVEKNKYKPAFFDYVNDIWMEFRETENGD